MNFLGNLLDGDGDEIIFFIIVFLFLFFQNHSDRTFTNQSDENRTDFFLFFIIVFGLLFLAKDSNF